ncbi:hypothetical protein D3C71_1368480 [compost metagenome]
MILEATVAFGLIFNITVAVTVAIVVHPTQRSADVGPQLDYCLQIAGGIQIHPRQHYKKRRGIDTSVVAAEWDLAKIGHLATAHLVKDLARLRIR